MEINYNIPKIKKILESIYGLFSIPVYFLSPTHYCVTGVLPESDIFDFCIKAEQFPELHHMCTKCDNELLLRCENSHNPEWHLCHAGLFDGVVPVLTGGIIIGYIFFGHLKTDGSKFPNRYNNPIFHTMYEKLPYFSLETLSSFSHFLSSINFDGCVWINKGKDFDMEFESYFDDKIIKYIDNNIDKDLNVTTICNYFHISKAFFYKKWCKNAERSFASFVLFRRINIAKKMIRETNLPIYKIAEQVGITSYSYFSYAFRKQTGMTPTQYRNKIN